MAGEQQFAQCVRRLRLRVVPGQQFVVRPSPPGGRVPQTVRTPILAG